MDGYKVTNRDHFEVAAERGSLYAGYVLASQPELPEDVEYLVDIARTLFGRSGVGMAGASPLSPLVLEAYARLADIQEVHPWEFEALLILDAALAYREDADTEESILPSAVGE